MTLTDFLAPIKEAMECDNKATAHIYKPYLARLVRIVELQAAVIQTMRSLHSEDIVREALSCFALEPVLREQLEAIDKELSNDAR